MANLPKKSPIPEEARTLIKDFEDGAWRNKTHFKAYVDHVGNGTPITIGYGYTNAEGYVQPPVKLGDVWTKQQAEDNLDIGIERVVARIMPYLTRKPTPNQLGAFVSFVWNLGIGNFRSSTMLKRFNAGDITGAAEALTWWNKAQGKVLKGLVRRREAEKRLFLKP